MASMLKLNTIATTALGKATVVAAFISSLICLGGKAFRWSQYPQAPIYCTICLHDVAAGERYRKLRGCGHCFHAECIDGWFELRATCPFCRSRVAGVGPPSHQVGHGWRNRVILGFLSFSHSIFGKGAVTSGGNSRQVTWLY